MSAQVEFSSGLKSLVEMVGAEVSAEDIDVFAKLDAVESRGRKVKMVLDAWAAQQEQYRKSQKRYSNIIIGAFLVQSLLINVVFFLIGFAVIEVDKWVASAFILGVFAEVTGLTFIVFKFFFPASSSGLSELVGKL